MSLSSRLYIHAFIVAVGLVSVGGCLTETGDDTESIDDQDDALSQAACIVSYDVLQRSIDGYKANITIKNQTGVAYNGWTLTFTFPGNDTILTASNAEIVQTGHAVTATNESSNSFVAAGSAASFGFTAYPPSGNLKPADFVVNGVKCNTVASLGSGSSGSGI
jgi:hypothetical protein